MLFKTISLLMTLSSLLAFSLEASELNLAPNPQIPQKLLSNFRRILQQQNGTDERDDKSKIIERIKELETIDITKERISNLPKVINEVLDVANTLRYNQDESKDIEIWLQNLNEYINVFLYKSDDYYLKLVWGDQYKLGVPWWEISSETYPPINGFLKEKKRILFLVASERLKRSTISPQIFCKILVACRDILTESNYLSILNARDLDNRYRDISTDRSFRLRQSILKYCFTHSIITPENYEVFLASQTALASPEISDRIRQKITTKLDSKKEKPEDDGTPKPDNFPKPAAPK